MANNFCPSCGHKLDTNASFCANCGYKIGASTSATEPQSTIPGSPTAPYAGVQQWEYTTPVSYRSKVAAGLLGIFLGGLGIHKFYLGYATPGIIMLLATLIGGVLTLGITSWVMCIIGFIEGIIYLTKSDQQFEEEYVINAKHWF